MWLWSQKIFCEFVYSLRDVNECFFDVKDMMHVYIEVNIQASIAKSQMQMMKVIDLRNI